MNEYVVVILPLSEEDGGGFVGLVPDLQGCMSDGDTREEALANTQQAMQEWIELKQGLGEPLPEPGIAVKRTSEQGKALMRALQALMSVLDVKDGRIAELESALEAAVHDVSSSWERNLPLFESPAGFLYRADTTH